MRGEQRVDREGMNEPTVVTKAVRDERELGKKEAKG